MGQLGALCLCWTATGQLGALCLGWTATGQLGALCLGWTATGIPPLLTNEHIGSKEETKEEDVAGSLAKHCVEFASVKRLETPESAKMQDKVYNHEGVTYRRQGIHEKGNNAQYGGKYT